MIVARSSGRNGARQHVDQFRLLLNRVPRRNVRVGAGKCRGRAGLNLVQKDYVLNRGTRRKLLRGLR